ncbi:tRNA (N6-threonylcarbamoyladenosine(37)-N6)-methyltransferase TrmO [Breoghania sp.]|uniref:tRNA (N6-threonylcarbamoyladenosine(37)-N6)-methyltransferase TrmO n=1 Tax=Breoghania sp. TaxID=2065378 RepID=UPI002618C5C6|nr:tRNA (N6-threonylcarbamoyladenosine(37)-N6)-methyltransferase TrmO [Breoghania sp.]MDJ0930274.1 tRNA (N6-threonylcarbamoyladenosine(37)-N6)-methyltransferase TrmO [Breoghania sp.]
MTAELKFIGHIETPYKDPSECPRNISLDGPQCTIILDPDYHEGLTSLEVGQHILVLYWFENTDRSRMLQRPGGRPTGDLRGTFALRSPHRPNPIAAAVLPIAEIGEGRITVYGLDCCNGTKLLDIKPAIHLEKPTE